MKGTQCSSVDLPDPPGPMAAMISPARIARSAPREAGGGPNDFSRPVASSNIGVADSSAVADRPRAAVIARSVP